MMRNWLTKVPYVLLTWAIILNAGGAWASTADAALAGGDKPIAGAPLPPTSLKKDQVWNMSKSSGWENRFFDKPLPHYNFSKSQERSPTGSGIPLKAPGMLPGITFGVEMHSFQALQSVVPPESLSKSLSFQQNQPLLLSPSNISPDYNAGFLRFTW